MNDTREASYVFSDITGTIVCLNNRYRGCAIKVEKMAINKNDVLLNGQEKLLDLLGCIQQPNFFCFYANFISPNGLI